MNGLPEQKQKRAMLTVALSDVSDDKVIAIKQKLEDMIEDIPDAAVELRIGTVQRPVRIPDMVQQPS